MKDRNRVGVCRVIPRNADFVQFDEGTRIKGCRIHTRIDKAASVLEVILDRSGLVLDLPKNAKGR